MKHYMTLNPIPFKNIQSGIKTIELRLNDEKRKLIHINDEIVFQNRDNNCRFITVKVTKLYNYSSFEELYNNLPLLKCGYTQDNINTAKPQDMEAYYSKALQAEYGVLGIEFERIDA